MSDDTPTSRKFRSARAAYKTANSDNFIARTRLAFRRDGKRLKTAQHVESRIIEQAAHIGLPQTGNDLGATNVTLAQAIRAVESLPEVWNVTPSPAISLFLQDLLSLPQQYTPSLITDIGPDKRDITEPHSSSVDYPLNEVKPYGFTGPGISKVLALQLRLGPTSPQRRPDASRGMPDTLTDAAHLESALLNVALNARAATPAGGDVQHPAALAATPKSQPERGRGRVLVVDDDVDVGRVTGAFLRKAGFDVITASNGNEALATLGGGLRFDALVTDYAMLGMNGVDLVLQARELHVALPALVITGYVGAEGLDRLPSDVTILRKPFQREDLMHEVKHLVEVCAPERIGVLS